MYAYCTIEGTFKENSKKALETANHNGAWGGQSYSQEKIDRSETGGFFDGYKPAKDGHIKFTLSGFAPWNKLHKIAKLICDGDYIIKIEQSGEA